MNRTLLHSLNNPFASLSVTPFLLAFLAALVPPAARGGSDHLETKLVSDAAAIAPGAPFTIAVEFEMEEEWHIYWRNPGDAGLATSIEWNVPEGFTVEPLGWPVPQLFGAAPEVSYGYGGKVVLAARVTPPSTLVAGSSVEIGASARWLVCKEACIPGNSTMTLRLPVEKKLRANDLVRREIARYLAAIPTVAEQKISAVATEAGYTIRVPDAASKPALPVTPSFLPYEESVIDHSATQKVEKVDGATLIHLAASPFATARAERLRGALVQLDGTSPRPGTPALEVDIPVASK